MSPSAVRHLPSVRINLSSPSSEQNFHTFSRNILPPDTPPRAQWRTQDFFRGGGSTNSVEDRGKRGRRSGGGSPLVRGSGGSCNLVQEISFHILKFSQFLVLPIIYGDNQFICHC